MPFHLNRQIKSRTASLRGRLSNHNSNNIVRRGFVVMFLVLYQYCGQINTKMEQWRNYSVTKWRLKQIYVCVHYLIC